MLVGENCENDRYIKLLSRGGLKIPSDPLSQYVCDGFAILDSSMQIINESGLSARDAEEYLL